MGKRLYLSSSQRLRPEQAATPGRLPRGAPRQLPSRYARPPIWLRSATGPGEGRPPQLRRKGVRNKPIGLGALELTATSKGARASAHRHGPGPASAFSHAASFPFPCGSGALPAPGQASRLPSESPAATGSRSRSPRAAAAPPPSGRPACPDPSGAGAGRRAARQEGGQRRAGRGRPVPRHRLPPAPQEAEGAAGSSCSGGVSSAPCPAPPAASVLPRVLPPLPPHSSPSSCWLGLRLRLGFPRSLEPPNMNGVVCAQRHQVGGGGARGAAGGRGSLFPARGMAAGGAGSAVGPAGRAEPSASPPGWGVVLFARHFSNPEVAPRRGGAIRPQAALQGQAARGERPEPGLARSGSRPGAEGRVLPPGTRIASGSQITRRHRGCGPGGAAGGGR